MKTLSSLKLWLKIVLSSPYWARLLAYSIWYFQTREAREPSKLAFQEHCASCHGVDLKGTVGGPSLIDRPLSIIDDYQILIDAMRGGDEVPPSHDWRDTLPPKMLKAIALYINERQQQYVSTAASYGFDPKPAANVASTHHDFALARVSLLQSRPYGMTALPDGRLIVAEKTRGLSLIERDGQQGEVVAGTPRVWDTILSLQGAWLNLGSMLDVALHPDYEKNGWIYISHTDRCWFDCLSPVPVTMVQVLRGRIKDMLVDQQGRSVHRDHYTPVPDEVAAGRLAFDKDNHLLSLLAAKTL